MSKLSEPKQHVLAADLGGTHLRVAVVNSCGQVVAQVKQPTPRDSTDPETIVRAILEAVERVSNGEYGKPAAASIVVPGAVDVDNAVVVHADGDALRVAEPVGRRVTSPARVVLMERGLVVEPQQSAKIGKLQIEAAAETVLERRLHRPCKPLGSEDRRELGIQPVVVGMRGDGRD